MRKTVKEPLSPDDLWNCAQPGAGTFDPAQVAWLPQAVRRYLGHAMAPGTRLASAVRLRMHGHIKLKGWHPFTAEQVICWNRGMIWRATVRMWGMPICGSDRLIDGQGAMGWKLFGILPIVNAAGQDTSRSAAGRMNLESVWLPSVLCAEGVAWRASGHTHLHADFTAHGEKAEIDYTVGAEGGLERLSMPRWGNPEGGGFQYVRCGGFVEEEGTFAGYTIPKRMRVGWYFGSDRFEREGEFFRVSIDDAIYR